MSKVADFDQRKPEAAQRRFEELVKAALTTAPKPMKDVHSKQPEATRPKRKTAKPSA
jgi:hypothetical protein